MSSSLIARADAFAEMHFVEIDHRRKYTNEPYMVHPREVADIVRSVTPSETTIAAALLHDTVEDTGASHQDILLEFGNVVAELVWWLTDASRPEDGNRGTRKWIDRLHLEAAPPAAQTIKLADLISNTRNIVERDPKFAAVYLEEKEKLLPVLLRGDLRLHERAWGLLVDGRRQIGGEP